MTATDTTTSPLYGTFTGYGPTRKTRASAQREADRWNASGDGTRYQRMAMHGKPSYWETCVAEVQPVAGGFACAYLTTREPVEPEGPPAAHFAITAQEHQGCAACEAQAKPAAILARALGARGATEREETPQGVTHSATVVRVLGVVTL